MTLMLLALSAALSAPTPPARPDPTADIQINIGRAEWGNFDALVPEPRNLPTGLMLDRVENILRDRECVMRGQSYRRFDITVPWVVQVEPDGRLTRLIVADIGCRPLETFVAELVVELAERGDLRPAPGARTRLYGSDFNFNLTTTR
ncbi:MAG TPA: hypothetical protein VF702_02835 [Allosphingosinicella sp.]|jgi:hypothetical protein